MSGSNRKPVTKPATRRGRRTRQKLLTAAEDAIGTKGYDQTSIGDITRRAGVAQGTFYIYFADKTAVLVELVRELGHSLRQEIAQATAGLTDRLEIERAGLRAFFDFTHRHRNLYKIVRQAEFVDEEVYRWYYHRMAEGYMRGLSQAMDEGQIRRLDPECLAYCLMGLGDFLGMRWVLWNKEGMPDDVFESMMAFIRRGLEVEPQPDEKPS
jgi:AcrR family transcriptional regulator